MSPLPTGNLKTAWETSGAFLHRATRKDVTRSVTGGIPTRERGNDQLKGVGDWSAVRPPSLASQLLQGSGTSARNWLAVRPPSRASSLPQKSKGRTAYTCALHHSSGRALARLQLLILIHPPPRQAERRCLSGDGRAAPFDAVELIACRSKRSRPEGNAPG